jgi:hemolysin III
MNRVNFTSVGEEIFNSVTHGVAAVFCIPGLIYLIFTSASQNSGLRVFTNTVYGVTLFLLYLTSTLYHSLTYTRAQRVFQVFDHSSIFLLIAGTYTPIVPVVLDGWKAAIFLGGIWTIAICGVVFKSLWIDKLKILSVLLYIGLGWASVLLAGPMRTELPHSSIILLIVGGLLYTVGTLFYAWKKMPFAHGIWHFFVMGGSIAHFFAITLIP